MAKSKEQLQVNKRDSIIIETKKYCGLAKKDDFIDITEWSNGEGVDITIGNGRSIQMVALTWGQFTGIKKVIKYMVNAL